jgi:hypothetical protein
MAAAVAVSPTSAAVAIFAAVAVSPTGVVLTSNDVEEVVVPSDKVTVIDNEMDYNNGEQPPQWPRAVVAVSPPSLQTDAPADVEMNGELILLYIYINFKFFTFGKITTPHRRRT